MSEIDDCDSPPRPAKRRRVTGATTNTAAKPKTGRNPPASRKPTTKKKRNSDDFIVEDNEDEDAFVRAKRPAKPRSKIQRRALSDEDDDEDAFEVSTKIAKPRIAKETEIIDEYDSIDESDFVKPKKPKHRIHTPAIPAHLPEMFIGDGPPPSTNPWSIRGPIWRKDSPAAHAVTKPAKPDNISTEIHQKRDSGAVRATFAQSDKPTNFIKPHVDVAKLDRPKAVVSFADVDQSELFGSDIDADELETALSAGPPDPDAALVNKQEPSKPDVPISLSNHGITATFDMNSKTDDVERSEVFGSDDDADALEELLAVEAFTIPNDRQDRGKDAKRLLQPASVDLLKTATSILKPKVQASTMLPNTANELADLPLDAFDSSPTSSPNKDDDLVIVSSTSRPAQGKKPNMAAPQNGLRQTTLFGGTVKPLGPASQAAKKHAWPLATQKEPPTHHQLNQEAMQTWVYPTNLGTIRDYQYNIVARGLFHNLLVALPTGLGKTFIAATIMLNWFRWTQDAQIVFVAPTKPLVAQQIDACFRIVGIPRSETVMLTGATPPGLRAEEWKEKRVFFMTPQTIINDLKTGMCDPKRIVLLVVDEAHRATGGYAYVEVVKFLRRFNQSFRVLALTATPGSTVEAVQQVIDGLDISRVEIRTETSLDIRQYVHARDIDTMAFDYSEEQQMIFDLLSKAVKPVLSKLNGQNAYWLKDPLKLTAFGCTQALRQWQGSDTGRKAPYPVKAMVMSIFNVLASLAHGISLLKFHGISPFFRSMTEFRNKVDGGEMKGKYGGQIRQDENFGKMMTRVQSWINNPDFLGHPKLEYLRGVVLNHFLDAGEGSREPGAPPSATRIMIFAHWRDSAEEIVRVLKRNEPMIRPHVFVGQADSKHSEGMGQKRQLEVIQEFKDGKYNTLVATSIGEEGLDIGEVDLIVCYDASSSPIRMLQRMGRTGRKRKGNIVLLLMHDKEEKDFEQAKDNYEKMQGMISSGTRFTFHDDKSPRIVPRDIQPAVDKRVVEIPVENSQADLPEPKRGRKVPKRPPKVFRMPDNVRTGFVKASRMDASDDEEEEVHVPPRSKAKTTKTPTKTKASPKVPREPEAAPLPFLDDILLNKVQERELERKYQYVVDAEDSVPTVTAPRLDKLPQVFPGPSRYVKHGRGTTQIASLMQRIRSTDEDTLQRLKNNVHMIDLRGAVDDLLGETEYRNTSENRDAAELPVSTRARKPSKAKGRSRIRRDSSDMEAASSSPEATPTNMRIATQGIDLGSDDTQGEDEAEGEPDSELAGFIVDSDAPIELVSSSLPQLPTQDVSRHERFYVSQEVICDESDGGLPELGSVVDGQSGHARGADKDKGQVADRRRKKRQVVEDDSDD